MGRVSWTQGNGVLCTAKGIRKQVTCSWWSDSIERQHALRIWRMAKIPIGEKNKIVEGQVFVGVCKCLNKRVGGGNCQVWWTCLFGQSSAGDCNNPVIRSDWEEPCVQRRRRQTFSFHGNNNYLQYHHSEAGFPFQIQNICFNKNLSNKYAKGNSSDIAFCNNNKFEMWV